ncbi:C-5 cytosine-specific DNA methylase [Boothiomyces sp. JEL0866]|nr:C-5 cytosine-specific DNA methylase [Boothiomyces sp. JEL0866]
MNALEFFSGIGGMLDNQDPRAQGLLHLISCLELINPPKYIFLENVVNFEVSNTRNILVSKLSKLAYTYKEWIISPTQLGIPNDRPRYYLTAVRTDGSPKQVPAQQIIRSWDYPQLYPRRKQVADYLATDVAGCDIPKQIYANRQAFDKQVIVHPSDTRTSCFTKAYGHHGVASGGYLQTKLLDQDVTDVLLDGSTAVEKLGLRFFSPLEIARLHAFPIDDKAYPPHVSPQLKFELPSNLSIQQQWKVLGNSMCVAVVGEIMRYGFEIN